MTERDKNKILLYTMSKGDRLREDAERHLRILSRSYPFSAADVVACYRAVLLSDFFEDIMHELQKYMGI